LVISKLVSRATLPLRGAEGSPVWRWLDERCTARSSDVPARRCPAWPYTCIWASEVPLLPNRKLDKSSLHAWPENTQIRLFTAMCAHLVCRAGKVRRSTRIKILQQQLPSSQEKISSFFGA